VTKNPAQAAALRVFGAINSGVVEYIKLILVLGLILALAFVVLRFGLPRLAGAHNLADARRFAL